jgi:hypothetical protein
VAAGAALYVVALDQQPGQLLSGGPVAVVGSGVQHLCGAVEVAALSQQIG